MLLLAASHIEFIYNLQFQLRHSSFHSAKIIQKHIGTYYSSIFKYILFIFIIHSNIIVYYSNNILYMLHLKIYSQYIINHYIIAIMNLIYIK